ncbi:MAG: hypothetical protein LC792_02775 [Actinobacteria bacterium]|nr:hypothetical protein [Actinomycetota bacterium]
MLAVDVLAAELGRVPEATEVSLLITNFSQVLFAQQLVVEPVGAGRWLVLVPVTERGDAIGLRDDATALCLDWFGGDDRRKATGGASRSRATAP